MATKNWINLYLPSKVAYHVKILLGGILVTMFFNVVWKGSPFAEGFWYMVVIMVLQLEVFMAIASRMFKVGSHKSNPNYKGTIITRLLAFFLLVLIIAFGFLFLVLFVSSFVQGGSLSDTIRYFIATELKSFFISWLIGVSLASLFFFYMEWSHSLKREQKLREEKLIFQYETLKSQVNPHFLFNSLNTLSSLVAKDSSQANAFISKFSSIYRYILENRERDRVPLSEEVAFVRDYFFLQRIRDEGKVDMEMEIENPDRYEVLPISIQLLVENALKHNAATRESPLRIKIVLEEEYDRVSVENNRQKKQLLEPSSKTGLKNLKERILLMTGKGLIVEESPEKFVIKVPLIKKDDASTDH